MFRKVSKVYSEGQRLKPKDLKLSRLTARFKNWGKKHDFDFLRVLLISNGSDLEELLKEEFKQRFS